ncbi:Papain family cysteine protease containing protein [Brugia malayi]|uniref:Papain family cysteine protease containing protein n=2 Tax=Brugia malayi TaxID=6279 RepID=A0A4E9FW17_BRUMA|nr:Papain family cysteine protease containing protein [Brugia malayi]VIO97013.1 Papain family cysteine protease containing protein [Brugia malayi]
MLHQTTISAGRTLKEEKNFYRLLTNLMKAFFILHLASFLLLTYANPLNELDNDDTPGKIHTLYQQHYSKYKTYLKKMGKKHDPSVPEPIRLLKFVQSLKMIDEHNQRYSKGLETYKVDLNEMSDWTEEEKERLRGYYPNLTEYAEGDLSRIIRGNITTTIPKSFDYRKKITVLPASDQGRCGVCFIFSALGALEMYVALRTKKRPVKLSVQDVMDCSGMEKCKGRGGNEPAVFRWVAEHGVKTDKSYPYKENDSVSCPRNTPQRRKYGLADAFYLPPSNEQILKKILALYGPVCVSLHSSLQSFVAYRSEKVNHAVIAVGYGVQNGMEYFIIKNSWGPTWGQKGYGRIRAGVFMCGIGRFSNVPIFK